MPTYSSRWNISTRLQSIPGSAVSSARNCNWEAPVAAMMRARPRAACAPAMLLAAWRAAAALIDCRSGWIWRCMMMIRLVAAGTERGDDFVGVEPLVPYANAIEGEASASIVNQDRAAGEGGGGLETARSAEPRHVKVLLVVRVARRIKVANVEHRRTHGCHRGRQQSCECGVARGNERGARMRA